MTFRADVQGLRAVAVLLVILFHTNSLVPGGFLGVDVFFVISGFVITKVLIRDINDTGRINWTKFYLRRFQRLFPAAAVVLIFTILAAVLVVSPYGYVQNIARYGLGAILISANYVIGSNHGYFEPAAELNPLLHTWSLSVEEQFYLIFPLLIFCAYKSQKLFKNHGLFAHANTWIFSIFCLSYLAMCASLSGVQFPGSWFLLGFYSPLTRAWEFIAGALLATLRNKQLSFTQNETNAAFAGLLGLGLILSSAMFPLESEVWPNHFTMLPVLGTCLLIVSGTEKKGILFRILSAKFSKKLGDMSYSLYLWHWPIISLGVICFGAFKEIFLISAMASFFPAILSYTFVEQRVRYAVFASPLRKFLMLTFILIVPMALTFSVSKLQSQHITAAYSHLDIKPNYSDSIQERSFQGFVDNHFKSCKSTIFWETASRTGVTCGMTHGSGLAEILILGDSHAQDLAVGMLHIKPQTNFIYFMIHEALNYDAFGTRGVVDAALKNQNIKTVYLVQRWPERGVNEDGIIKIVAKLTAAGKKVLLLDGRPEFPFDAFGCKFKRAGFIPSKCSIDMEIFERDYLKYSSQLHTIFEKVPDLQLVRMARRFCDKDKCLMTGQGGLLYRDNSHLTLRGAKYIAEITMSATSQKSQ